MITYNNETYSHQVNIEQTTLIAANSLAHRINACEWKGKKANVTSKAM
jgi:hypothetical protein